MGQTRIRQQIAAQYLRQSLNCNHHKYQSLLSTLIDGLVSGIAQIELDDLRAHQQLEHDGCRDDRTDTKKHHRAERAGKEGTIGS